MYAETLLDIAMQHADSMIQQAINGDQVAQSKLVNLWFKRIYNYNLKFLSDHDMAMEVSQKTFICLYEKISTLKKVTSFKSWLYRVATNYCREELRKGHTFNKYFTNDEDESNKKAASGTYYNPSQMIEHKELGQLLQRALMTLKPEQREVLIMKEYEGLKFVEIAEILNESENTVKSRLYYGLTHIRKYFATNNISKETLQL